MRLDEKIKKQIDDYFNNISGKDFIKLLDAKFGFSIQSSLGSPYFESEESYTYESIYSGYNQANNIANQQLALAA